MTRLALLRHGHTAWNRAGRIQGRTDIPLDDAARAHLAALRLPDDWAAADIVASPLRRAMDTAALVSSRAPRAEPALMEMDWGAWEGCQGAVLRADPEAGFRDIEDWGWQFSPPEGERPADLRDRLLPWLGGLQGDTVAVCHIGVMRVLMAMATGWDFDGPAPFRIKRDRLFVLHVDGSALRAEDTPVRLVERAPCG
ncbi:histidine phosphatase family protein [uncultured Tateyamaria sp.]|uniref:histidine phosphatase family protein n=1 Tax=uncultured Tateyamaria sp. TaxID=455651 RepID=UPI0026259D0B|nr:histidine phosphatase family protein [uncultured Tateyamaria sp.]